MPRIVFVNGRYRPYAEAAVHVEDRGFQFADAVYEVIEVDDGDVIDETRHLDRLERSLGELRIAPPMSRAALRHVIRQVIRRNRVRDGTVYLQVSRGQASRDFVIPSPALRPTVVCLARQGSPQRLAAAAERGIAVRSAPDIRWGRCDIKTVMLLPACLAKSDAQAHGAKEAWLVDRDGLVTEGAASNAWIVTAEGAVVTRATGRAILAGVTRSTTLDAIRQEGLELVERAFSIDEAKRAREAFITSASNTVMPVVEIDGATISDGRPGALTRRLRQLFHQRAERATI